MSYNTSYLAANEIMGAIKHRAQLAQFYFADIERAVVKATAPDGLVPKEKHVQNIVAGTSENNTVLSDSFKCLHKRLHEEKSWQIAFKSLIIIHRLLREGDSNRVVAHISQNASVLNMTSFRDNSSGAKGLEQGSNIKAYAAYLEERAITSFELKVDYTRADNRSSERINGLTWKTGLEEEVRRLQRQVKSLLDCKFYLDSIDNDITTEALRLLVKDLLRLFQILNEGVIKILKEFFELGQADAKRALEFYKSFIKQTEQVTAYFDVARKIQYGLGMTIPEIKHAPLALADSLQQYVDSADFGAAKTRNNVQAAGGKAINDIFASSASAPVQQQQQQQPALPTRQQAQLQQPDLFASLAASSSSPSNSPNAPRQPVQHQQQLQTPLPPVPQQQQPSSSNFDDLLGLSSAFTVPPQQQQQFQFAQQPPMKPPHATSQFQQFSSQQSSMVSVGLSTPQMQPRVNNSGFPNQYGNMPSNGFNGGFPQPQAPLQTIPSQSSFQSFTSTNAGFNNYQVVQPQGGFMQQQPLQQQQQQPMFSGMAGPSFQTGPGMPQHQQPLQFHQQMSGGLPQARQPQFTGQQNPFGQQQQQQQPQPQQQQQQLWM